MAEPIDKDTRGPVNLRIKFRSESLQQFIERYGVDVSRGGIFIRTREPLPVGTRLKLDFQLVDTAPLFQGDGTVVWIREHDPSRAGVTPGMGVRFDRLSPESQTTLDTILEEKIRLQQAGVAPGSIAKAGAGIAVRRPSGAFATLEAPGAKPAAPPPLPVEVKRDTASASAASPGAAPAAPMPMSSSRSGAHATGSSSIFSRPRTTSGMRAVPVPSALFEPPTAADIDKALSVLEEKSGPAPALPFAATVIKSDASKAISEDEPTKVFDTTAQQEFSVNEAVTGPASVLPENGVPIEEADGVEGDLTQRRLVDPTDLAAGHVRPDGNVAAHADGKAAGKRAGKGEAPPPAPGAAAKAPAPLDAPLASLVDSGSAPSAKAPPPPPAMKPAAPTIPPTDRPGKAGVPVRITTDRPAAVESGRFRSDTRYKRRRSKAPVYVLAAVVIAGAGGFGGFQYLKRERAKRAAAALAAAAAAPPIGAGQDVTPPPTPPTSAAGVGGGAAAPTEAAGTGAEAPQKAEPAKAAEAQEATPATAKTPGKTEGQAEEATKSTKPGTGKSAEKGASGEKSARAEEGSTATKRRREKAQAAGGETPTPAGAKTEQGAGEKEKRPAGEESAKAGGEAAKSGESAKTAEAAKPAQGEKAENTEKAGEAAKSAEAATPSVSERPALKITSSPAGADVVIDGVPVGTTPFSSRDITADGTHAISLKKDGYETHERMISGSDWSRGKGGALSLKVNIKLKRAAGEKPATDTGEKKEKPPEVEILTPSPIE